MKRSEKSPLKGLSVVLCLVLFLSLISTSFASPEGYDLYYLSIGSDNYVEPEMSIVGGKSSARWIARYLQMGGSRFGITLLTRDGKFITREDIQTALNELKDTIGRDQSANPLLVFYFIGHGISEGVAWSHFSVPGNIRFHRPELNANFESLSDTMLYAGDLVEELEGWNVPYLVLLDSCYEGEAQSFELTMFSAEARRNLRDIAEILRFMNEFRRPNPVIYSTVPGEKVPTTANPISPDSEISIGPLARRALIIFQDAEKSGRSLTVAEFYEAMIDPALDSLTLPAFSKAEGPPDIPIFTAVPNLEGEYLTRYGTGVEGVDCCFMTDKQEQTVPDVPYQGQLEIFAGQDYISDGQAVKLVAPPIELYVTQDGPGSFEASFWTEDNLWSAAFTAPENKPLAVGHYTDVQDYPFQEPDEVGMDISGDGRGCNDIIGEFVVHQIEYDQESNILDFQASFTQFCDDETHPLKGRISLQRIEH